MNKIKSLQVFYNEKKVGTLALMKNNIVAFEYDNEWLNNGFSISPYSIPLKKQVFIPKIDPFDGLILNCTHNLGHKIGGAIHSSYFLLNLFKIFIS